MGSRLRGRGSVAEGVSGKVASSVGGAEMSKRVPVLGKRGGGGKERSACCEVHVDVRAVTKVQAHNGADEESQASVLSVLSQDPYGSSQAGYDGDEGQNTNGLTRPERPATWGSIW